MRSKLQYIQPFQCTSRDEFIRLAAAAVLAICAVLCLQGCSKPEIKSQANQPPVADKIPQILREHNQERIDPYYWLRDDTRTNPKVLAHLEAENAYTQSELEHTQALQARLFDEIAGRLVAEDKTVPVSLGLHEYFREYRKGGEYPVYVRRKIGQHDTETILNVNELASGHEYFRVGNWALSQDETQLAYLTDSLSRRIYTLNIKDLASGKLLPDEIKGASTSIAWSQDGRHIYYVKKDEQTLLPYQVYRHELGTKQAQDVLVYEEMDPGFYTSVYTTRSKKFTVIASQGNNSSEIRVIPTDNILATPELVLPREDQHEYRIRHVGKEFFIATNWNAPNFKLVKISDTDLGDKSRWQEVVPHDPKRLISDFEVFEQYLVVNEQFNGLPRIKIIGLQNRTETLMSFPDESYSAWLHTNPAVHSHTLRYGYSSLTRPESVYEYDMRSGQQTLLKQDEVLGGFSSDQYESKRIEIKARDGVDVPVSLVYRKDLYRAGQSPLYITGYGAYGSSSEPEFSAKRLSLLDRGVVFAIAHIRGGEEMGRQWYEDGKMLKKRNTFWDFLDATDALVERGYGHRDKVIAMGGSAGGLLMGVIANEAPEKYLAIIAHVPFVDALTTMLDESIPLTTGEFLEWGNPKEKVYHDYILSYSPYDQIKPQNYPHLFVTAGLHDSQVQYFEPAKWVAKLRALKTDNNQLLLHVDMTTGHGGASGRYQRFKLEAMEYAFVLSKLNFTH